MSSNLRLSIAEIISQYVGSEAGQPLGYIAEEPKGFFAVLARQAFATHRPFKAVIMDVEGSPIMWACILTPLFDI